MKFCIEVSGDFACFTRPEMKVERVSYDVITPSAARSIFEAILWKPAIQWHIDKIEILKPIKWVNLRRNEVKSVISTRSVSTAMKKGERLSTYIDEERQQRAGLFLRDVSYRLHAHFTLTNKAGPGDNIAKFRDMFSRRAKRGQCVNQPYLGCREFTCAFELVDETSQITPAINESRDLGWMLFDLDYENPSDPSPLFFNPSIKQGVINIPERQSDEVRG